MPTLTIELNPSQFLLLYGLRDTLTGLPGSVERDGYHELLNQIIYACEMQERETRIKGKLKEVL